MNGKKITLRIGLMKYEPGWEIVLNQIGLSWNVITSFTNELSNAYSVIILNSTYSGTQKKEIERFLSDGGTILSVYGFGEELLSIRAHASYFRSVPPLNLEYCKTYDILDVNSYGRVLGSGDFVSIHRISAGTVINIPFNVNSLMLNGKSDRKNFYSKNERLPNEIVSSVSKSQIRVMISSALEYLHHRRSLPFVHKWYFPNDEQTLFTFRIDSDKGDQLEIEELFQLCERYAIPTTWFLDVKSHEQWLPYFSKFSKQEIGIHCYEHATYDTVAENVANFDKAITSLNNVHLKISGAAAPRGSWNKTVSLAFEKLGLTYSSEFSFDHDNFPSFPWLGDTFSSVLQLPIHPICSGTMRRAGFSAADQIEYFVHKIDHNLSLREPICFYHHPTHHFNDVFEQIFRYINGKKIKKISYAEYAAWWKKRETVQHEFTFDPSSKMLQQTGTAAATDVWYRISISLSDEVIQKINSDVQIGTLTFSNHQLSIKSPDDIMRSRAFDWRHYLINTLELYYRLKQ